eukprot:TRINITY_DN6086_c0_g1_i2.p2 TRINITY_DN6086_c0_g1~~TRINITY_DN6086_c0_g1_i2.p2  ORF type:complete len:343 (+),score=83.28 TRINITY_DN6086_c0_g1_i2:1330-2358(+)
MSSPPSAAVTDPNASDPVRRPLVAAALPGVPSGVSVSAPVAVAGGVVAAGSATSSPVCDAVEARGAVFVVCGDDHGAVLHVLNSTGLGHVSHRVLARLADATPPALLRWRLAEGRWKELPAADVPQLAGENSSHVSVSRVRIGDNGADGVHILLRDPTGATMTVSCCDAMVCGDVRTVRLAGQTPHLGGPLAVAMTAEGAAVVSAAGGVVTVTSLAPPYISSDGYRLPTPVSAFAVVGGVVAAAAGRASLPLAFEATGARRLVGVADPSGREVYLKRGRCPQTSSRSDRSGLLWYDASDASLARTHPAVAAAAPVAALVGPGVAVQCGSDDTAPSPVLQRCV